MSAGEVAGIAKEVSANNQCRIEIVRGLLKYGAFLQRVGDRVLRPFAVSQQEFAVISAIARLTTPVYQTTLVVDLLVERSNLSKIVKRLERKKLVEVWPIAGDRRLRLLKCSPAGRDLFKRAELALKRWNKEWMAGFDQRDLCFLAALLGRLSATPDGTRCTRKKL